LLFICSSKVADRVLDHRVLGGPRRLCVLQVFLYTLLGSVLMLLRESWRCTGMPAHGHSDLDAYRRTALVADLGVACVFAHLQWKMPMWPVHTWLPDAHVEAPTAGSVILAAIS